MVSQASMPRTERRPQLQLTESCPVGLTTNSPDEVVRIHRSLQRAARRVVEHPQEEGALLLTFPYTDPDPGGLLLFFYALQQITAQKRRWIVYVDAAPNAVKWMLNNYLHMQLPPEDRSVVQRTEGDFLLREVTKADQMVSEVDEWTASVREGSPATEEQVALWAMQVAEVATNAFQHAGEYGRVLLAGRATSSHARLAVIDLGSGIPSVVRKIAPPDHTLRDGDLIKHACERGVTSRCVRQNQGRGLSDLVQTVKTNKGRLQIFSGEGLSHVTNGRQYRRNECGPSLAGTLVLITLNL